MSNLEDLCLAGHVVSSGATWCCNLPKGHTGPHDDGLGDRWGDAPIESDPIAAAQPFIQQCGSCDAGLPMGCTCPTDDYRPVMARLVAEVERLRAEVVQQ